jgi:hypothetical protein
MVQARPGRVRLKASPVKGNPALGEIFPEIEALEMGTRIITGAGEAVAGLV